MSTRYMAAVVATTIAVVAAQRAQAQEGGIAVGAMAPGASVETLDGRSVDLASYIKGKPAVLEFWATWCPLCKQLEPQMAAARIHHEGKVTFVSVGVSTNQTAKKQQDYVEAKHLGGEFVFDRDGKAVAAYSAPHTSYLVVIDAKGKVVYTGVGGEQNVEEAIAKALPMHGM